MPNLQSSDHADVRLMAHPERLETYGAPARWDPARKRLVPHSRWKRENIVLVMVPWPESHSKYGLKRPLWVHKLVADHFRALFAEIELAGKLGQIKTLNGTLNIRMKRGRENSSRLEDMSSHSFGAAIDINARWNGYGKRPAARGEPGSLVELVPIARACGFAWGGDWRTPDGMHFEVGVPEAEAPPRITEPHRCAGCSRSLAECAQLSRVQGACCAACDHSAIATA